MAKKWIPDASEPPSYGKPYATILIRLFAGFCMFFAGFEKATNQYWATPAVPFSAAGYLQHVAGGGYFHNWYVGLAGASTIGAVNFLVVAGEVGVGLALILGLLTRFACYMGTIEVGLIWITEYRQLSNGVAATGPFNLGWSTGPLEIGAALIAMFIVMAILGGGLIFGLDSYIEKLNVVKKHKWIRVFFG